MTESELRDKIAKLKIAAQDVGGDWGGAHDPNFAKLIGETINQESHYGALAPNNPAQIDPIFVREMAKAKYQPQLGYLGVKYNNDGSPDLSDPRTAAVYAGMVYATKNKEWPVPTDIGGRARIWKRLYNTAAGKGKETQYIKTNSQ